MHHEIKISMPIMEQRFEPVKNTYEIHEKRLPGWRGKVLGWGQSLAWWLLNKVADVNVHAVPRQYVHYNTVSFEEQDILKPLFEHIHDIESVMGKDVDRIVLGPRQLDEINMDAMTYPFHFQIQDLNEAMYRGERFTFKGYTVQMIPWLDGILVIPKLR